MPSKAATISVDSPSDLRADARRNRQKLLAAAEEVFSERGADASLEDVARRAKVGIGTLYRHFPTREALLAAACDERLLSLAEKSRTRDTRHPPAESFRLFLEELVAHASTYRGLATSLGVVLQNGSPGCHSATEEGQRLLARAQSSGTIRRDIEFDDVICMAAGLSMAASQNPTDARRIPRLVGMLLDGLRTAKTNAKAPRTRSR